MVKKEEAVAAVNPVDGLVSVEINFDSYMIPADPDDKKSYASFKPVKMAFTKGMKDSFQITAPEDTNFEPITTKPGEGIDVIFLWNCDRMSCGCEDKMSTAANKGCCYSPNYTLSNKGSDCRVDCPYKADSTRYKRTFHNEVYMLVRRPKTTEWYLAKYKSTTKNTQALKDIQKAARTKAYQVSKEDKLKALIITIHTKDVVDNGFNVTRPSDAFTLNGMLEPESYRHVSEIAQAIEKHDKTVTASMLEYYAKKRAAKLNEVVTTHSTVGTVNPVKLDELEEGDTDFDPTTLDDNDIV
jgi:hypothetical protein